MPRNGSGQYNPLTNTWNPPVTGVLATGADFQAQLNDISAAITQSVSKDGQTPMTANLPMGNNSIVGIASGTEISPSISANGDTNTGLYFPAADTVGVAVGGVQALLIDSTGIEVPAGTAAAPSLTTTGDTNTGLYFPAADTVAIATGGVKRVEVDASGNLGVGVTPSAQAAGAKSIQVGAFAYLSTQSNGAANLTFGAYEASVNVFNYLTTGDAPTRYAQLNGVHTWLTAPSGTAGNAISFTQAMTLDASGNLLVGYTTSNGNYKLQVNSQIFATSSTIATSDGRYKENITPIDGALNLVKELNPVQFSWKKHPVHAFDTEVPTVGFIAQELQQVLSDRPYLNSIVKCNEITIIPAEYETREIEPAEEEIKDKDGNVLVSAKPAITEQRLVKPAVTEKFLGIAEGNLIAILTKAIQEQQALIEAQKTAIESLTARIAALEAK